MTSEALYYLIIGILILDYLADTLLEYLNARRFGNPPPEEVADLYNREAYEKTQSYNRANYRFGFAASTASLLATLGFLVFGGFGWLDTLAISISQDPIGQALVFFGLLFLGGELIGLPFSWYRTFVIEERFGFNKQTVALFWADKLKGWALAMILGGGLLALVMVFYRWAGPGFWIYAWLLIGVFTVLTNLLYSRVFVPLFNRQEPLEDGPLKDRIHEYARRVGFELKKIFVIDGSRRSTKANAYFSGFGTQKRVTLYDTLIGDLDEEEVVAVLAHEVGHYKRNHILFNLAASLALTGLTLYILSLFINHPGLSLAIGVDRPSFHAALLSFALLYSPISEITGLAMNFISRKFEFQADAFARETYAAEPLVTSLKKLSENHLSNLTPHPAYVFVRYSHPPLAERIRKLQQEDRKE
ncbi:MULTISPECIES: M48 family metallopeptidase [Robiginitalea]|mgnify:CR=1 FL=1|uniref:M48 family metallopeptidase n=1 Tax=Robiginitalea TaxID=252306 RepID=UPI00234B47DB|nr:MULTISPECIES: M48 family metallopeptidase [unclassified Robiginitalea]MDC6354803.1 M48 family metallopeptidase [Robiginitalea sp. PM2]MDC6375069.1 M48 family metallopeptidase [Robiginitalea sp. SP8]